MTISDLVVEARVRRVLARDGEVLRKTRPGNAWAKVTFGDYYTVDQHTGNPQRWHCDLEQLARECNVLRPGEVIAAAGGNAKATTDAMPAGRYWVGDLCYVLHDAWESVWRLPDGAHALPDGRRIAVFSTIHGDGIYDDEQGREYAVDSGSIGCILAADIRQADAKIDLGAIVMADQPFAPGRTYPAGSLAWLDGGVLELAGVRIHLDNDGQDEAAD